jgi:ABC-type glycerol-3-phosphate transport system permease component
MAMTNGYSAGSRRPLPGASYAPIRKRGFGRVNWRSMCSSLLMHGTLLVVSIFTIFPLWWCFISSLKGVKELYSAAPTLWPQSPSLANYQVLTGQGQSLNLGQQTLNSVIVTGGAVTLTTLVATMAGYGFARIRFRGRDGIFVVFLLTTFVPPLAGMMAQYELMDNLHLRNSLPGLILLLASGVTVPVFIMRQSFLAVPQELEDAARIDGTSRWGFFLRIGIPMVSAAMTVVVLIQFVYIWGEYVLTYTMEDSASLYTLAVAVQQVVMPGASTADVPGFSAYGGYSALAVLTAVPVIVLFIVLQKWFVRGLAEGALKF